MTDFSSELELKNQLSYFEATILLENVNQRTTLERFIVRLDTLYRNTKDPRLLVELEHLLAIVKEMTPKDFAKLKKDILLGSALFPPNYQL